MTPDPRVHAGGGGGGARGQNLVHLQKPSYPTPIPPTLTYPYPSYPALPHPTLPYPTYTLLPSHTPTHTLLPYPTLPYPHPYPYPTLPLPLPYPLRIQTWHITKTVAVELHCHATALNDVCYSIAMSLLFMGCRFTFYSLFMDIQNSFLDIHNSFLDIQK